jgi:hypothetical protein
MTDTETQPIGDDFERLLREKKMDSYASNPVSARAGTEAEEKLFLPELPRSLNDKTDKFFDVISSLPPGCLDALQYHAAHLQLDAKILGEGGSIPVRRIDPDGDGKVTLREILGANAVNDVASACHFDPAILDHGLNSHTLKPTDLEGLRGK